MTIKNQKVPVYWITGLSGSGKSTVSKNLIKLLTNIGHKPIYIDGDDLRKIIGGGFSKNERCKQAQKYSYLCKLFNDQGIIVVAAVGGLIKKIHIWNRLNIKNYVEIFLKVPIEELQKRNKNKLYSNFKKGKIKNVVGLDIKADFPVSPDIEINNYSNQTPEQSARKIFEYHKKFFEKI